MHVLTLMEVLVHMMEVTTGTDGLMSKVRGEHTDVPSNLVNDSFAADECAIQKPSHPIMWSSSPRLPCAQHRPLVKALTVSMQSQISTIIQRGLLGAPEKNRHSQKCKHFCVVVVRPHLQFRSNMHQRLKRRTKKRKDTDNFLFAFVTHKHPND
jgi:hypothetical protein